MDRPTIPKKNIIKKNNSRIKMGIRGSNPKKFGFLDWIWMGNPKPKKIPKIQKIQNPNPKNIQIQFFFLLFKIDIQLN
jgi:hypothetical protein